MDVGGAQCDTREGGALCDTQVGERVCGTHEWERELSVTQVVNGDNATHRWGSNPHNTRGKDQCDRRVQQGLGVT